MFATIFFAITVPQKTKIHHGGTQDTEIHREALHISVNLRDLRASVVLAELPFRQDHHNYYYCFSTCSDSISTGVARPRIVSITFRVFRSGFTSSTTPVKSLKGPSMILTESPRSKVNFGFGCSDVIETRFTTSLISASVRGVG